MGHDDDVGSHNAASQHPSGALSFERDLAEGRVTILQVHGLDTRICPVA
jgi:hypothetical protein